MTDSIQTTSLHSTSEQLVDVEGLRAGVNARIQEILHEQGELLASISADTSLLLDAWETLLSGGKRLRAAFAYWGYRAINPGSEITTEVASSLFRVGAAMELFQAAALFHDDVMDRSDTRRGNATAHKAFEYSHLSKGYEGDAAQYGISTAILLGDLSLVASESEFRDASLSFGNSAQLQATRIFDLMRTTVTVGQFLDVHAQVAPWTENLADAKQRAFDVIRTKTSSYSVTYPLLAGAALAGATDEQLSVLEKFAMPVGIAYQLYDDLLGAFGDSEVTGKPIGDDIREGKRTVLVLEALERVTETERVQLQQALGNQDLIAEEVEQLLNIITQSGAPSITQKMVEDLAAEGLTHLDCDSLNVVGTEMLRKLTSFALKRSF